MLETVVTTFDGNKARRQRAFDPVGRAAIRTASAIRTGVKIKHMFPGKIFENLHTEGFQVVQFFIGHPVAHRLDIAPLKTHEKYIKQGSNHMKMLAQGQKAQKEEKGNLMNKIRDRMQPLKRRQ